MDQCSAKGESQPSARSVFLLEDLLAPIIAISSDVVAAMGFAGHGINGQRRLGEGVMGTTLPRRARVTLFCCTAMIGWLH